MPGLKAEPTPAAAALPNAMFSAQGPPVKCGLLMPVKIRPSDERQALAHVWSVGDLVGLKRGTSPMSFVAVVTKDFSWLVRGILVELSGTQLVGLNVKPKEECPRSGC